MKAKSGIYRIDLGNGNFYIGSAVNFARREGQHRSELIRGAHCNRWMQNAWDKREVFEFTVLEECEKGDLLIREQLYLDQLFSHPKNVNIAPVAGSSLGLVRSSETRAKVSAAGKARAPISPETRAKMSAAQKGRAPISDETRAKLSAANTGKTHSPEARAKMSASSMGNTHFLGQTHSPETRANMSAAKKGVPKSPETRAKMSAAQKGRAPISDETRAKLVAAWVLRRQRELVLEDG